MSIGRLRAILDIDVTRVTQVIDRSQMMCNGLGSDLVTYANPTLALPAFQGLITNFSTAHQAVLTRVIGARPKRDAQRILLLTGMEVERMFVQSLADASPIHADAIITNAGLVVAKVALHTKALLTLRLGKQSGSVLCTANVGLLVGAGTSKPNQYRCFGWQYTLDGSKTFVSAPTTTHCKTLLQGLPVLTTVGVRVSLTNSEGPGPWSQVVTILVQ